MRIGIVGSRKVGGTLAPDRSLTAGASSPAPVYNQPLSADGVRDALAGSGG